MKILFLQDDFWPHGKGGAASVVLNFAKELVKMGHIVSVITTVRNIADEGVSFCGKIKVFSIYTNYHLRWQAYLSLYNPQTVGKVKKILEDERPQVIHAHNLHHYLSYHCLKLAKDAGTKVFLTAHDAMLFHYGKFYEFIETSSLKVSIWQQIKRAKLTYNPIRNIFIKYYLRYVDKIFAVSNCLKEALNQNGIDNVEVWYNWIDVGAWENIMTDENAFKKEFNLEDKKIIFFAAGNSWAKGGQQILLALKEIVKTIPEAQLLIIGSENSYVNSLLKKAIIWWLNHNIVVTGQLEGSRLKSAY